MNMDDDLAWLDWDDDDDDAPPDCSSSCPRVKSAFSRDAQIVDGAVQGRLCSMLNAGRLWLGSHSFVGVVRHG